MASWKVYQKIVADWMHNGRAYELRSNYNTLFAPALPNSFDIAKTLLLSMDVDLAIRRNMLETMKCYDIRPTELTHQVINQLMGECIYGNAKRLSEEEMKNILRSKLSFTINERVGSIWRTIAQRCGLSPSDIGYFASYAGYETVHILEKLSHKNNGLALFVEVLRAEKYDGVIKLIIESECAPIFGFSSSTTQSVAQTNHNNIPTQMVPSTPLTSSQPTGMVPSTPPLTSSSQPTPTVTSSHFDDEPVRPCDEEETKMPSYILVARSNAGGDHIVAPTVDVETEKQALNCMVQYAKRPNYNNFKLGVFYLVKEAFAEKEEIEIENGAATVVDDESGSSEDQEILTPQKEKELVFKVKPANKKKGKKLMIDGEVIGETHQLHDVVIVSRRDDPVNIKKVIYQVHVPMENECFENIEETEEHLYSLASKYTNRNFAVYASTKLKKEKTPKVNVKSRVNVKTTTPAPAVRLVKK